MATYLSKSKRSLAFFFVSLFVSSSSWALNGMGLDYRLSTDFNLAKKFGVNVIEILRCPSDMSDLKWSITIAELSYKPISHVKLVAGYTLFLRGDMDHQVRNRYHLSASWLQTVGRVNLEARTRFQSAYVAGTNTRIDGFREKLKASMRQDKFLFFTFAEPFCDTRKDFSLCKVRFAGGVEYSLTSHHAVEAYYYYHLFRVQDPVNFPHLLGFGYSYSF